MIIAIEGMDASGKNTQTRKLAKSLKEAVRYSFPIYDNPSGQKILANLKEGVKDPLVHQALMLYNKCAVLPSIMRMADIGHVVLDRYWQSAYAYGVAEGMDPQEMIDIHAFFPQAHINIYLDIPPEFVKVRRPEARDKNETDINKLTKVRDNYYELWDRMKNTSSEYWAVVDGTNGIDDVYQEILDHIARFKEI